VQKAIRGDYGDKVKLPDDPFEGFRDKTPTLAERNAAYKASRVAALPERTPAQRAAAQFTATRTGTPAQGPTPDLDHLRRENEVPASVAGLGRDDISDAARAYADQHAQPGTRGHAAAADEVMRGDTEAVMGRVHAEASAADADFNAKHPRVPRGSPTGGRWTRK